MKIESSILIATCLVVSIACQPIRNTRNSFLYSEYCYDGKQTGLDTIINLNGYYYMWEPIIRNVGYPAKQINDTIRRNCLFFNNGLFEFNFDVAYFQSFAHKRQGYYNRGIWGRYIVKGDTIKAQFIESPGGMSWEKGEVWFKIIGKSSIKELYFKYRDPITNKEVVEYQNSSTKRNISLGTFTPFDSLPNPDRSWLKKRKWFWCDEKKYKEWKQLKAINR